MTFERRTATEGVELREEGDTLTAVGYAAMFNRLSQNLGDYPLASGASSMRDGDRGT
jgi:hypothetical protein